jgi:hypothetical protein
VRPEDQFLLLREARDRHGSHRDRQNHLHPPSTSFHELPFDIREFVNKLDKTSLSTGRFAARLAGAISLVNGASH